MNSTLVSKALRGRVLLVEDEADLADLTAYQLRQRGLQVDVLGSGHRVMERACQQPYQLYVLDVMLPGMKGLEICQMLREHWRTRGGLILVLSALGSLLPRKKVLAAGADEYLPKPFAMSELMERAEQLLSRAPQAQAFLSTRRFGLNLESLELQVGKRLLPLSAEEGKLVQLICLFPPKIWFGLDRFYSMLWSMGLNLAPEQVEGLLAGLAAKLSEPNFHEPFVEWRQDKGLRWSGD